MVQIFKLGKQLLVLVLVLVIFLWFEYLIIALLQLIILIFNELLLLIVSIHLRIKVHSRPISPSILVVHSVSWCIGRCILSLASILASCILSHIDNLGLITYLISWINSHLVIPDTIFINRMDSHWPWKISIIHILR